MKIYTKTGDKGKTGLIGGRRIDKASPRIEAYGALDELNSHLGLALTHISDKEIFTTLREVQKDLFILGADLATPKGKEAKGRTRRVEAGDVKRLEELIDGAQKELKHLKNFILPGGGLGAAHLHIARAVCRRAESKSVALSKKEWVNKHAIVYLNRLSDLLFVLARLANSREGVEEVEWS